MPGGVAIVPVPTGIRRHDLPHTDIVAHVGSDVKRTVSYFYVRARTVLVVGRVIVFCAWEDLEAATPKVYSDHEESTKGTSDGPPLHILIQC